LQFIRGEHGFVQLVAFGQGDAAVIRLPGGKAMVEQARERLSRGEASSLAAESEITPERIARAAEAGDALGRAILFRAAVLLARVQAGALALLNPDTVGFGGGVSNCLPLVREVFERELRLRTPSFSLASLRILQSSFGDRAGVIGAATLPVERRAA
jgi:predicted NBD/HSP70 family sugar kinase